MCRGWQAHRSPHGWVLDVTPPHMKALGFAGVSFVLFDLYDGDMPFVQFPS